MFSREIYIKRREALRGKVKSGIILMLGNSEVPYNYGSNGYYFRQDSSFLYYFGLNHADYVGVLDIDAATDCIYGDDYSLDSIIWMGNVPTVKEQAEQVGVSATASLSELSKMLGNAIKQGRRIHFLPPYRANTILQLNNYLGIDPSKVKQYVSEELIQAVVAMREIKAPEEIEEMVKACDIGYDMHTAAMRNCHIGGTEREVAGIIEGISKQKGAGVSFHCIVSQHGETLHNHDHNGILEDGRLLLVDAGAENVMNYCSDFTRTYPVNGKFSPIQKDVYEIVQKAFETGISMVKPGIMFKEVHLAAARIIAEGLTDLGFMKGNIDDAVANGAHAMFFPTGLGHTIGLDVHEMEGLGENYVGYNFEVERSSQFGLGNLRMAKRLQENQVVTVEPGIYFIPQLTETWAKQNINNSFINFDKVRTMYDFGGIRVEDCVQATKDGYRILGNKRIPFTVKDIETYMQK